MILSYHSISRQRALRDEIVSGRFSQEGTKFMLCWGADFSSHGPDANTCIAERTTTKKYNILNIILSNPCDFIKRANFTTLHPINMFFF